MPNALAGLVRSLAPPNHDQRSQRKRKGVKEDGLKGSESVRADDLRLPQLEPAAHRRASREHQAKCQNVLVPQHLPEVRMCNRPSLVLLGINRAYKPILPIRAQ